MIRVMDDAVGTPLPRRHVQRLEHELGAQMIGHRSAHDPAAACVDHNREEQESGPGRHVGDVGDTELVGCIGLESTLDKVRCATSGVVSARSARSLAPRYPCQAHLSHQSSHALVSDINAVLGELGVNSRRPVGATAALMNVADALFEDIIGLPAPRRLTASPRKEPAQGDAEHAGHRVDVVEGLIRRQAAPQITNDGRCSRFPRVWQEAQLSINSLRHLRDLLRQLRPHVLSVSTLLHHNKEALAVAPAFP